jgi:hypothetical protein
VSLEHLRIAHHSSKTAKPELTVVNRVYHVYPVPHDHGKREPEKRKVKLTRHYGCDIIISDVLKIAILIGIGFLGLWFIWAIWILLSLLKGYTEEPVRKQTLHPR